MSKFDINVVGFPRSGNTWIARLLGDALNSKVVGFKSAIPLATEGLSRHGKYTIRQLHLHPVPIYGRKDGLGFLVSGWEASVPNWEGERVVHAIRDPRDVAVSAMYYWERETLEETIWAMFNGTEPFQGVGAYHLYVKSWLDVTEIPVYPVNYEILHANPVIVLMSLLSKMEIPNDDRGNILKVVARQEINAKRKEIAREIESSETGKRPYGKTIQLKHLRKGVPGEWKKEFKESDGALMDNLFHDIMVELGYICEGDHEWFKSLKK